KGNIMIEDLSFQYMSPEDLDQLRNFAEKSNRTPKQAQYNAQFYATLETILQKHGHDDWGDEVYIAEKKKEREGLRWYGKELGYFLDWFVGYGRKKWLLLVWSLVFISAGTLVFSSKVNMELKKPGDNAKHAEKYCPFLYAVDLFLPIIGLGYSEAWTP